MRPNCFVAGTEVHMDETLGPVEESGIGDLAIAAACIPVAVAGYSLSRSKKKRPHENNIDDIFATYGLEHC